MIYIKYMVTLAFFQAKLAAQGHQSSHAPFKPDRSGKRRTLEEHIGGHTGGYSGNSSKRAGELF